MIPVAAERGEKHDVRMLQRHTHRLARARVPDPCRPIRGRRDHTGSVAAESCRLHGAMLDRRTCRLARPRVPDPRGPILRQCQHEHPIGAERRREHGVLMLQRRPTGCPVRASHTRAVRSWDAVSTRVPSGLNVAENTAILMLQRRAHLFACPRVPHPRRPIPRGCDHACPIGAELGREHGSLMSQRNKHGETKKDVDQGGANSHVVTIESEGGSQEGERFL